MEAADLARDWQEGHGDPKCWSRRAQVRPLARVAVRPLVQVLRTGVSNAAEVYGANCSSLQYLVRPGPNCCMLALCAQVCSSQHVDQHGRSSRGVLGSSAALGMRWCSPTFGVK
jgi:hypothetical protein